MTSMLSVQTPMDPMFVLVKTVSLVTGKTVQVINQRPFCLHYSKSRRIGQPLYMQTLVSRTNKWVLGITSV